MTPNGPPVELVSVAERLEAVEQDPNSGHVLSEAERSEARRGFCRPGTNYLSYTSVAVQV